MTPLISVLMPVYNGEELLPACIESIRAQTLTDFELIAVDDGSGDGTAGMLARLAGEDRRIRPLSIKHGGIVAALNRGLEACRGSFIARMDVDDLMTPERLREQLDYLKSHPDCGLCGAWVEPYGIGKELTGGGIAYHEWLNSMAGDGEIKAGMFVDSPIAHSTFFAPRELFERLGGYREVEWAEDYDFILRANQQGVLFGNVPRILLRRGDRAERLTRIDRRYSRKSMFRAKAHYFAKGPWLHGREGAVIAGTGPSGRIVAAALAAEGAPLLHFIDNRAGPPGRTVRGIPAHGYPEGVPKAMLEQQQSFFLLCIGDDKGRLELTRGLEEAGRIEGRDFLRFI